MPAITTPRYELAELYRETQRDADGNVWWEAPIGDGFATVELATAAATAALAARTDDARYPWICVVECAMEDGEHVGWAAGWVTPDGVFTEGDYENDDRLWATETPIADTTKEA